jgi:hypothetical protein
MPPDQPQEPIDQLHKQLRAALDQHLASLSHQYEESLAAARYEVAAEADQAMSARLEAVQGEWSAKLDAEVASARTEVEQRVTAELTTARADAEQQWAAKLETEVANARNETEGRLLAESMKARAEAERQFAATLASEIHTAREETERRLAAESLKARMEAEQQAAENAARLRSELEKSIAAERQKLMDAQSKLEQERTEIGYELNTLRQRVDALEAERQHAQTELDAHKASSVAALEAERQQAQTELDAHKASSVAALETERQRASGEIESHRRRLEALQEQLRKAEADVEAEQRRGASERDDASREAASRLESVRAESAAQIEALRRQAAEQLDAARSEAREAREAAERNHEEKSALAAAATAQLAERQSQRAGFDRLLTSIQAIDAARSLSEALDALLQQASAAASRAAIFLIDGDRLRAWKAAGFPQLDSGSFDSALTGEGLLAQAIQKSEPIGSGPAQPAPTFAALSADRVGLAVPIIVGGHPVALLYADNGSSATPESPATWPEAVETMTRHASTVLALLTAMRATQLLGVAPTANGEGDEQSARRYARLLVSEIKLYNEAAVKAGRERQDLLERLRPEIERARRLYEARVPQVLGARGQYFQQELVQTLADGNPALLGTP